MKTIRKKYIMLVLAGLLGQHLFGQVPNISYTGPQAYVAGSSIAPLTVLNSGGAAVINGQASTFAGSATAGNTNSTGTSARFNQPSGVVVDALGNLYIADAGNNLIRKITPAGVVTTFAGSGTAGLNNATGTSAAFNHPIGMAMDASGNIYVAEYGNNDIRKITPAGVVSTFAGSATGAPGSTNGTGTGAGFNQPSGITIDASGNIYVADYANNMIRKITSAGVVSLFAGSSTGIAGSTNGMGTAASFGHPFGITVDASGNLYVADRNNNMIRKITSAASVTTLAGSLTAGATDASGTSARFSSPTGVSNDAAGNIYVTDQANNTIRAITPAGVVTTLSGTGSTTAADGMGTYANFNSPRAAFNSPYALDADAGGNLYVAESAGNTIRKVLTTAFTVTPALPAGMVLNTANGTISGTPSAVSPPTAYNIAAYDLYGADTTSVTIEVDPGGVINPSPGQNYITTYMPRVAGLVTSSGLDSASTDKNKMQASVQYFDGLGRPIQTVQVKASPSGHDVVQPEVYDQFGREVTKYLPYTITGNLANDGSYKPTAVADQGVYYITPPSGVKNTPFPISETLNEASPIGRALEQGAPGDNWQLTGKLGTSSPGHTIKMVYTVNNSTSFATDSLNGLQVALYNVTINGNQSRTLTAHGYYAPNQLEVTISKDENWTNGRGGTMETYTDKEGHVVLKRAYNHTTVDQVLSTYYLYDDLGNLVFVLPPTANGDGAANISKATLDNLCYQYRYDTRNRLSQKKIPGKGWEFTVYNVLDQPVATQDSLQRNSNNWLFNKYDALGRVAESGTWNNNNIAVSQPSLQGTLTAITTNLWESTVSTGNGYTNVAWPTTYVTATLEINYYDGYTNIPGLLANYHLTSGVSQRTLGLLTAKKTAVLNTPTDMLWDVVYYDDLGRTITTYAQHYLGGTANTNNYDLTKVTYNFTNAPTTTTRQHFTTASTTTPLVTIANTYLYDHVGRKLKTWEQITNGSSAPTTRTLISQIDYNEIGQVRTKHLHSTDSINFYQNISYSYNERGWLTADSSHLFAMQLYYNAGPGYHAWNGNIMNQYWGTPGSLTSHYDYLYDRLNRIITGNSPGGNNENSIAYDLEGNITALTRYAAGTMSDKLAYTYIDVSGNQTNQLQSIIDNSTNDAGLKHGTTFSYAYDGNGNLKTDPTKGTTGISIGYNLLNLPQTITGSKTITYTYDATGQKLRRVSPVTGNTDYIAGIEYDGTSTVASTISFIQTEEGKAVPNSSGGYEYIYYLGDNLGNTRVTFGTKTGVAAPYQNDDYYPFGLEVSNSVTSPKNEYLYNKKELQEELTEYDYGARFYDPVIARWNVIDPMAENHYNVNPYNYVLNNPLIYYDQYGLDTGKVNPKPEPVHQLKEVTITAKKESKSSGFGLAALGIASRVKNVPKWLWVTDTFDQEVPVLDVLTDALTLYYLSKDIKPAIVKSSPAIPDAKDLPWDKGKSPGEDWTWKGKGDAESGKGNWVNDKTGQKLHPDFDHPDPKGPHWGLQQPDGEKYDIFPNGNVEPNNK